MGCNCKSENKVSPITGEIEKPNIVNKIIHYSLKVLGYLLFIALLPVINLVILWIVFKILILNANLDFKSAILPIFTKYKQMTDNDDNDEDDSDYDILTEDDVEIVGVEKIINEDNK